MGEAVCWHHEQLLGPPKEAGGDPTVPITALWVRFSAPVGDGQLSWTFFPTDTFQQMDVTLKKKKKITFCERVRAKNTGAREKQKGAQAELHKGWAGTTGSTHLWAMVGCTTGVPPHSQQASHLPLWRASALTGAHLHKYLVLHGKYRGLCVHTGLREGLASPLWHSCMCASSFYRFS